MTRRPLRARGFWLFEAMVALGILATFALVAAHLFTTSFKVARDAAAAQDRAARLDAALGELRRDVWNAARVDVPSPDEARLTLADGSVVAWAAKGQGGLTRTLTAAGGRGGTPAQLAWSNVAPGVAFRQDGGVLALVLVPGDRRGRRNRAGGVAREVPLVSQLAGAGGEGAPR